jgi:hypothetical protein
MFKMSFKLPHMKMNETSLEHYSNLWFIELGKLAKNSHFEQPPKRSSRHFGCVILYTSNMTRMVISTNPKVVFLTGHFDP